MNSFWKQAQLTNSAQGPYKRVLCVCSAGMLRSPTAALVLSLPPYNFNTRSAGTDLDYALIPVTKDLLNWADEIVCMERRHEKLLRAIYPDLNIICLEIPDEYEYRHPELIKLIRERYDERSKHEDKKEEA